MNSQQQPANPVKKKTHWTTKHLFTAALALITSVAAGLILKQKQELTVNIPAPQEVSTTENLKPNSPKSSTDAFAESVIEKPKDYTSYLNTKQGKKRISVTVLDETGKISQNLSQSISEIYDEPAGSCTSNLLQSNISTTSYLSELEEANSNTIDQLNLPAYTDHVIIGRLNLKQTSNGNLKAFNASMKLSVINVNTYSVTASENYSAFGNGFDEGQAKETSTRNLLSLLKQKHPLIN